MSLFVRIMRATPKIMTGVAVLFYLGTVITSIATGQEMAYALQGDLPVTLKARAFVLLFVQPLIPAMVLLSIAALLWRIDQWLDRDVEGSAE